MEDDTALLDPLVVAAPEDLAVHDEDRTDRNAAFFETGARLTDRSAEVGVAHRREPTGRR